VKRLKSAKADGGGLDRWRPVRSDKLTESQASILANARADCSPRRGLL
jgi:hypothetical protein